MLAIHGDQDDIVPYWNHGQRLEAIIESRTSQVLPGQSHALHHVTPEHIAASIEALVATLPPLESLPRGRRANN